MAFDAYLYIEGVQGDSTSDVGKNPKGPPGMSMSLPAGAGPIEIKNFGLNIEMPLVENRSATGAVTVGRADFEDFSTSKNIDISTGALLFFCLSGKHINKAMILVYRSTGADASAGKPTLYLRITYENIVITNVEISGGGDEMPVENLKFHYSKVDYTYCKTDTKTGAETGRFAKFIWDRVENSGTKSA